MIRLVPATLLLLALAGPALADPVTVQGTVIAADDGGVWVAAGRTRTRIADEALAAQVRPFAGRRVEVRGEPSVAGLVDAWLVSPRRQELDVEEVVGRTRLRTEHATLQAFGNVDLLEPGRRAVVDAYVFEPDARGATWVFVVAVEAETTSTWTIIYGQRLGVTFVRDVVRGKHRRVWVLAREGNQLLIQRGEARGWVSQERVSIGEHRVGLSERLPD